MNTWVKNEQNTERSKLAWTVSGQVLEFSQNKEQVNIRLTGLSGDRNESWITTPPDLPSWIREGDVFRAQLSRDVETFEQLADRPWALRGFPESAPLPITDKELDDLYKWCDSLGL